MLVVYSDLLATTVWLPWWGLAGAHLLMSRDCEPAHSPHPLDPVLCVCIWPRTQPRRTDGWLGSLPFSHFSVPLRGSWAANSSPETPPHTTEPLSKSISISSTLFLTPVHTLTLTPPHMTDEQAIAFFLNDMSTANKLLQHPSPLLLLVNDRPSLLNAKTSWLKTFLPSSFCSQMWPWGKF